MADATGSPATAPSSSQITSTQGQVAALEATIGHQQQESEALGQRYDAAQQDLQTAQIGELVTAAAAPAQPGDPRCGPGPAGA